MDHGTDWPETYEYVDMFKKKYPLTVLKPLVTGYNNLYEYCLYYSIVPSFMFMLAPFSKTKVPLPIILLRISSEKLPSSANFPEKSLNIVACREQISVVRQLTCPPPYNMNS